MSTTNSATTQPIDGADSKLPKGFLLFLSALSGSCGLAWEVLYARLFSNYFGDGFVISGVATITEDMIGTGSAASPSIHPPGFESGANHARGHLLARALGGSGGDPRNLVTLYQQYANSPNMWHFERKVRDAVLNGETVNYRVVPIYTGNNPIPIGITIAGRGSGGFHLDVSIHNINGLPQ